MDILAINCVGSRRCGDSEALGYVLGKAAEYPLITLALVALVAVTVSAVLVSKRRTRKG